MTPLFPISSVIHLPTKKYNKFSRTIVTILENEPSNIPYFPVMWSPHESCPVNVESVGIRMCQKMGSPLNSNALLSSNWLIISFPQKKWPGGIYIFVVHFQTHPWLTPPWLHLFGLLVRFDGLWELRWISSLGLGPWSGSTCPQNLMGKMMKNQELGVPMF